MDECGATNGRLDIAPSGVVSVEAQGNAWNEAQCFVSLDGVTFTKTAPSFTALTPLNGWASYGGGTASPRTARENPATPAAQRTPATPRGPRQPPGTKTRQPHRITAGNQAAQDRPGPPADSVLTTAQ